ncbi:MAG: ABC transporter permease [Desulfovibrionaceae bacterium]|nr:ABC transporter permease [Desulfovibrionaceae bacterium]
MAALARDRVATAAALAVAAVCLGALCAPWISPYDPNAVDLALRNLAPGWSHWCGADALGRDVLTRILYGLRVSLIAGILPSLGAMILGALLGVAAGYLEGAAGFCIMRLCDAAMAFPSLLLAMGLMYALGSGLSNICLAIVLTCWTAAARVARARTLSLKQRDFVLAAKAMGLPARAVALRHILPNCLPALVALWGVGIPEAILFEAGLSFLGLGAQPPDTSLGLMAAEGKRYLFSAPWISIAPGAAILGLTLAFNFLGDGLSEALDPKSAERP